MSEKHICVGYNKAKGMIGVLHKHSFRESYKCHSKWVIFEKDRWWCKRHAPSEVSKREEAAIERMIKILKDE